MAMAFGLSQCESVFVGPCRRAAENIMSLGDVEWFNMSKEKCKVQVTQTSNRPSPTKMRPSVGLRELRINLDKDIVHNYLIDKNSSSNNAAKKNMKQMTLTHYFKSNQVLDTRTSNETQTAVEKRQAPLLSKQFNTSFVPKDAQIQTSINNNGGKFNSAVKTEPILTQSTDESYMNDDLDVGEEFKYSDFLSRSIDPQVDVLNAQATQNSHVKVKPKRAGKSLAEKMMLGQMKTYRCDHCNLVTATKRFFINHIKTKHSQLHDESGFITCAKCTKKFIRFRAFKAHEHLCGMKFYYPCKFCEKKEVAQIKDHLFRRHAKEFDKKQLKEILQWSKSKRIRKASRKAVRIKKAININEKLLSNYSEFNKLVEIFCFKCDLSWPIDERKVMVQCSQCKTAAIKLRCLKCKKTYSNAVSAVRHARESCECIENNVKVDANKEALKIIKDRQTNNSIKSPMKGRMEQLQMSSTDKMILNENRNVDDLDIGEEFKYSEFLSSSKNAQMNVVNKTAIAQEVNKKRKAAQQPFIASKRFVCDYCGHRTQQKAYLKSHIENKHSEQHDENGFHTCARCDKKYRTLSRFHNHKKICGTKFYHPCKFCSRYSVSPYDLKKHLLSQHEKEFDAKKINELLQWSKPKAVRKTRNQGRSINTHLPKKERLFRSYFELNKVIKMFCSKCKVTSERELGKTKIQCLKCDTALTFQCQMCKKTYDVKASLLTHIRWSCKENKGHSNMNEDEMVTNSINSIMEGRQSDNSNSINLYTAPVQRPSSLPYKKIYKYHYCNDCDYKSYTKPKLLHHIRFHHVEDRSKKGLTVCPTCQKKFKKSRSCKAHQLVCKVNFDYKCKFCKFTTKASSHVKMHIKSAHADKIQGKNFTDIANEILKERKNNKEKYEATKVKGLLIENKDLSDCFDVHKVIKTICPQCHVVSDKMKYQNVKDCPKCEKLLEYQCQRCGQIYDKYNSAHYHMKLSCRLIKKK